MTADEEACCPARRKIAATNDLGYCRGYSVVLESAEVALRGRGAPSDDGQGVWALLSMRAYQRVLGPPLTPWLI